MLVIEFDGRERLSISDEVSSHVLVSLAHEVTMVAHVTAKDTRAVFVSVEVGFAVFVSGIRCN